MKVAIITNTCYEEIIPLAKYLSADIDVDLFSIVSGSGAGKELLFEKDDLWKKERYGLVLDINKKKYIVDEFNNYVDSGFDMHAVYFKSLAYFHPKNFYVIRNFINYLRNEKYELIHFNTNTQLIFFVKYYLPSIPIVITIHDPLPHLGEKKKPFAFLNRFTSRLKNATYILHSNYSLSIFDTINKNRSKRFMIPFGNHEWLFEYKKENSERKYGLILFIGRISKYKGIEVLLQSFREVKGNIPDAHLIIAGNGNYWFDYSEFVRKDGVEIINRYIPNNEIVKLIGEAHLVVLPYLEATQSGVVSTVFTFCKPIVATRTGGIPEVVINAKTGLLAEPNNSMELANEIIHILKSEALYNNMVLNISSMFNEGELSWHEISKKTIEVYFNVLNKVKTN